jgi:hypothetical protein
VVQELDADRLACILGEKEITIEEGAISLVYVLAVVGKYTRKVLFGDYRHVKRSHDTFSEASPKR